MVSVTTDVRIEFRNTEMCPVSTDHREHMSECIRPVLLLLNELRVIGGREAYFVIVPSMSDTTT